MNEGNGEKNEGKYTEHVIVAEGIEYLIRNLHDRVQTFGWET
jgi:hypothetical protein